MVKKNFTNELKQSFEYMFSIVGDNFIKEEDVKDGLDYSEITTDYFIMSVLSNDYTIAYKVLSKIMLQDSIDKARNYFKEITDSANNEIGVRKKYDNLLQECIEDVYYIAKKSNSKYINSGHMLSSIFAKNTKIRTYFKTLGVTANQITNQLKEESTIINESENSQFTSAIPTKHNKKKKKNKENVETEGNKENEPNLQNNTKYSFKVDGECGKITRNLNECAYNQQLEGIYGNDEVYNSIFNILSKRNKNNVAVVGKSGVGKSDIVRNIANLIVEGKVPRSFRNKLLLEIDANEIFHGTAMRGSFETKMKTISNEIKINSNYIFFIDSLETLMNAGFNQSDNDIFIETFMKDKNAMFIINCSEKAYSKYIAENETWNRYFEKVVIEEPNDEDCVNILKRHIEKLEVFHDVKYEDNVLPECVKFSRRYITDRFLPDSAIDILDKAGAKKGLIDYENEEIKQCREKLYDVRKKLALLKRNGGEKNCDEYDSLIKKEIELNTSLDFAVKSHNLLREKPLVNVNDIKICVSEKTNIPVTDLTADDKERLKNLDDKINKRVVGQNEAVDVVCRAIKRQRVGISNPNKPVVFLMAGSTGVGKSYLAKVIASEVFGDEKKIVRLDMAEYSDKTSISKLWGSGAGYVGYENGGILTEAIKKNKHCVLLLDEIEKANEEVHNAFLSMFDEGRMTDNHGVTVDFKNVIVIMTSNVGAREVDERGNGIGFVTDNENISKKIIQKELKRNFKPEFINRIDNIVYFNKLTDDNIKTIITLEIDKIRKRLESIGYGLEKETEDTELYKVIFNNVMENKNMGARPIIRELQRLIEDKVTDYIIDNKITNGHIFTFDELSN